MDSTKTLDCELLKRGLTLQEGDTRRILTEDTINQNFKLVKAAWPSSVERRALEIQRQIKMGVKFPFEKISRVHSANPQEMGQKTLTFFKQVSTLCVNPDLLNSHEYPFDVKHRAKTFLENCAGRVIGTYSDDRGIELVRREVAKFIEQRDGIPSSYENIFLTFGASEGLQVLFSLFSNCPSNPVGVLIPVPEYPMISAALAFYGIHKINYYLDEEKRWAVNMGDLRRAINESRSICDPKALVIINPGNPSGYVMTREEIQEIVKFAYEEKLFILADEVYQQNIYEPDRPFHSFKKIMYEMGAPYNSMELASVMTTSKGYMGECGTRIGFCELVNFDQKVKEGLFRVLGLRICPPILGQVMMYCMCNPPLPDEPSYELFEKEKNSILQSLKERAEYVYKKLNSVDRMSCAKVDGSMFFYPRIYLTKRAIKESEARNLFPDEMYLMELVDDTGICLMAGCEFGQKPQTYHFRFTFLPQMENLKIIVDKLLQFHQKFMERYADNE